jgi:hypothetical protein
MSLSTNISQCIKLRDTSLTKIMNLAGAKFIFNQVEEMPLEGLLKALSGFLVHHT